LKLSGGALEKLLIEVALGVHSGRIIPKLPVPLMTRRVVCLAAPATSISNLSKSATHSLEP
jgi:hypothetical protein